MKKDINDNQILDTKILYGLLKELLPEKNDYYKTDYEEELKELYDFNIHSVRDFKNFIKKHIKRLLEIDAEPLDEKHIRWYSGEYGKEDVEEKIRNQYWFAYPGLLRIALELEFGEEYERYSDKRDGI